MTEGFYLSRFTPSLLSPETLEAIFVQREKLATRLVELIRESVLTGSKHYSLLVGPRGIGKTHIVSLVYYRVLSEADLQDRMRIAWLREEECVVSFLDFLQTILGVLQEEYQDEPLRHACEELLRLSIEEAESRAEELLLQTVGNRTLLLIAENLDEIFQGLGKQGQEKLRAFIQNHPIFTILATSQSLFGGVSVRTSPFYGFFETHCLQGLSFEDAVAMMAKIARHQNNEELARLIQTPQGRFRVRAVHHLAGGNPRVYVIFSQLVTCESLDELIEPVLRTLDDLTPYYQDRMHHLSPQQKKIVDYFCQRRYAVSVRKIAEHNRVTHQTASNQLKKLRDMGYVCSYQVGRESYYELREPLMRISRDAKKFRGKSIRLLVAFLRNWYSHAELTDRLVLLKSKTDLHRKDLQRAIKTLVQEPDDPRLAACLRDYKKSLNTEDFASALEVAEEMAETRGYASDWMKRAICLRKFDREDEAEQSEKKALEFEPDTVEGWQDLGSVMEDAARHEEALASFDKAIELDPKDARSWQDRTTSLEELKRYEEALASYDKAIELNPKDAWSWRNRSTPLEGIKRYEEALTSYDKAIEIDPRDAIIWRYKATLLNELERYKEALFSYDKAIELDPNDVFTWQNRVYTLSQLNHYEEALTSCDKAIELDPKAVLIWQQHAYILSKLNRYEEALVSYDKAIKLDPKDAMSWRNRTDPLEQLLRYEEALESYDKAIELDPRDALSWRNRAIPLEKLQRYEEALVSYNKAIELDPSDIIAWELRAWCLDKMGRFEEALTSVDKALDIQPDYLDGLTCRTIILYRLGRREESLAMLERQLKLDVDNKCVWSNRAVALSSLGRHEEALASFDQSLKLASVGFDFHICSNRAVVLAMLGRWDEGVNVLDETLRRFAEEGGIDTDGEMAIVHNMLIRTQEVTTWQRHIVIWIELFSRHGVLSALGQGLVRSIPTLNISWISDDVARAWRDVWQELGREHSELEIPLRLLDAAVQYREKPDMRILLGVPIEERELLKPLLGLIGA